MSLIEYGIIPEYDARNTMTNNTDEIKLPPLSETLSNLNPYGQARVFEYAHAAVEADRANRAVKESLTVARHPDIHDNNSVQAKPVDHIVDADKMVQPAASAESSEQECRRAYDDFYHKIRAEVGYNHWRAIWHFMRKRLGAPVAQEPVATLHDDGHYTFKRQPAPYGSDHAGWRMDVFAAPVAAQPSAPDAEVTASEAVYAFAAWLTARDKAITIGSTFDATPVANLVKLFVENQGWEQPRDDYTDRLRTVPCEVPTPPAVEPRLCPKCGADRSKVPCPGDLMNCPIRGEAQATVEQQNVDKADAKYSARGYGHVYPRADGMEAGCGGPGICPLCSIYAARKEQP